MSEHLNAIQDLSHASLAYIKEALEKSEVAVRQLNDELRAERERVRQMEEALQHIERSTQYLSDMNSYPSAFIVGINSVARRGLQATEPEAEEGEA